MSKQQDRHNLDQAVIELWLALCAMLQHDDGEACTEADYDLTIPVTKHPAVRQALLKQQEQQT